MTGITRPLRRSSSAQVHSAGKRRPIVVELAPPGLLVGFRLHGTRRTYYLPIDWCYREAVRAELARQKAERRAERAARNRG